MSEKLICDKCGKEITDRDYLHLMVQRMVKDNDYDGDIVGDQYSSGSVAFIDYHYECLEEVAISKDIPSVCNKGGLPTYDRY